MAEQPRPPWADPPAKAAKTIPPLDVEAHILGAIYQTLIPLGARLAPRNQQRALGFSELGYACDRRTAYRQNGTPPTNYRDQLAAMLGTGFHHEMAATFSRLTAMFGSRFLVETPVEYRGIPGTCDLYDRELKTVVDWKTSTVERIRRMRVEGVRINHQVQVQGYAAGLAARGEDVRHVALIFVPRDGLLDGMYVHREKFDPSIADAAIDRAEAVRGKEPAAVRPVPDTLCGWCNYYQPGSTDLNTGCPGGHRD